MHVSCFLGGAACRSHLLVPPPAEDCWAWRMRAKAAASKRANTQVLCHGRAEAVATSASWSARGLSKVRMAKPREKRERKEAKRKEAQGSLGVILEVTSEVGFGQRSGLRSETIGVDSEA